MSRRFAPLLGTALGAIVLVPGSPDRAARLLDPAAATTAEQAVVDLLGVLGALVVGYLALTAALLVLLERVAPRSRARLLAMRLTPARWRRLVLATAGAAVVVAGTVPVAAAPDATTHDDVRPPPLSGLRLPDRPESPVAAAPPKVRPRTTPVPPVTVERGDSLWRIAERALGPGADDATVAAATRRWYRANRDVVGADPDLLLPGTRLVPPPTVEETRP